MTRLLFNPLNQCNGVLIYVWRGMSIRCNVASDVHVEQSGVQVPNWIHVVFSWVPNLNITMFNIVPLFIGTYLLFWWLYCGRAHWQVRSTAYYVLSLIFNLLCVFHITNYVNTCDFIFDISSISPYWPSWMRSWQTNISKKCEQRP